MGSVRSDRADLIQEFQNRGYRYVTNASELAVLRQGKTCYGLFFASASPRAGSDGIRAAGDPNMSVAYDKLRLNRPASEPSAQWATSKISPCWS